MDMDYGMKVVANIRREDKGRSQGGAGKLSVEVFGRLEGREQFQGKVNFALVEILSCVCRIMYSISAESDAAALKADPLCSDGLSRQLPEGCFRTFAHFCMAVVIGSLSIRRKSSMDICDRAIQRY